MNRNAMLAALAAGALTGCGPGATPAPAPPANTSTPESDTDRFALPVEREHGREAWLAHPALTAHLEVDFGGATILSGEMTFTNSMSRSRIDAATGASVIWDGETAWVSPAGAELPMARFHVLTWPYFVLAPLKLRDPGARLEPLGVRQLRGRELEAARLSFEPGIGDTPDDWYVIYKDPESSRMQAMAYIVTFGTTTEKAEAEPHAIAYEEFAEVDGALVPTRMRFYMWTEERGIHGDPIGELRIDDPRFVTPEPGRFQAPEGAREAALPAPGG